MDDRASSHERVRRNMSLVEEEIDAGRVSVTSFPHAIQFSPEHRCNIRCIMCYATVLIKNDRIPEEFRSLQPRTLERFSKLQRFIPYWNNVVLVGAGEPLLSPALPEMLRILALHPVSVAFTTHANLLDREMAELIVATGVRRLTVSMDAATRETYERVRFKASWDRLLSAIDTLNAVKRERNSPHPDLCFAGNFMRQNIEELPALIDFAADHGGAMVLATNTVIYEPEMEREALCHYPELTERTVVAAARRARERGILLDNQLHESIEAARILAEAAPQDLRTDSPAESPADAPTGRSAAANVPAPAGDRESPADALAASADDATKPTSPARTDALTAMPAPRRSRPDILEACQMPWKGLMVAEDGNVRNCCYTSPTIGNLNEQDFEEIWNGAPVQELRQSFLEGRPPEGCRTCFIFMNRQKEKELFVKPIVEATS